MRGGVLLPRGLDDSDAVCLPIGVLLPAGVGRADSVRRRPLLHIRERDDGRGVRELHGRPRMGLPGRLHKCDGRAVSSWLLLHRRRGKTAAVSLRPVSRGNCGGSVVLSVTHAVFNALADADTDAFMVCRCFALANNDPEQDGNALCFPFRHCVALIDAERNANTCGLRLLHLMPTAHNVPQCVIRYAPL